MKAKLLLAVTINASLLFVGLPFSAVSAASAGQKCSKVGLRSGTKKAPLICAKTGKKLAWKSSKALVTTTTTVLVGTVIQRNAVKAAKNYLSTGRAISRTSLIKQLEFVKFSTADATYGVDAQNTDWNAQAAKMGAGYLMSSAFSRTGLISQLEYEGFTADQATSGTDAQNADWNLQAGKKAASYLKSSAFSRSGLIDQLLYEGFTQAQAEYGVGTTGL